jgi:hypothetical protein
VTDNNLKTGFKAMKGYGLEELNDERILNFATTKGESGAKTQPNPHSVLGYLIHPRVVAAIESWLQSM